MLVGGGHAHLYVASQAARFQKAGAELSLVDPGMLWYSGMATGMLSGLYEPQEDRVDLEALCRKHGVRFHPTRAVGLDHEAQQLQLETGQSLKYDLLSINVGSAVDTHGLDDPDSVAWTVKPIPDLLQLKDALEEGLAQGLAVRVGVVGGGPTGCEIAANIEALCRRAGGRGAVTVLHGGQRLLAGHPEKAAHKLADVLKRRGIEVRYQTRVEKLSRRNDEVVVRASSGDEMAFNHVVVATGLVPSPTVSALGFDENGLQVDKTLAAVSHPGIFGAGDCIRFMPRELPKVGVFGVRQSPVLCDNLLAAISGRPFQAYEPQKKYLIILNLGDGTGLAIRGGWHWYGRLAMFAKNFIDKRFMGQFQNL